MNINIRRVKTLLPGIVLAFYWPLLFLATHIPRLPQLQVYGRDVTLHMTAYMFLTLLYWLTRYGKQRPHPGQFKFYGTVLLMAGYALADELTQNLVGRYGDFYDWLSDLTGCLLALLIIYFLRRYLYWLVVYWIALFVITHWPQQSSAFVNLPVFWQQFQGVYNMLGYLVLTFLWWRTISGPSHFRINRKILVSTLCVLPAYALIDETVSLAMQRGFDVTDLLGALAGIILATLCSIGFALHHLAPDPYKDTP